MAPVYDLKMSDVGSVGNHNLIKVGYEFVTNSETSLMLDIAAGTGWTAEHFRDAGYVGQIDAIEMNAAMLDIANAKGLYRKTHCQEVSDQGPLPVADDTYDIVTATGAFLDNHLPQGCIPYIIKALKVGGLFLFNCRKTEYNEVYHNELMRVLEQLTGEKKMILVKKEETDLFQMDCKEPGKPTKAIVYVFRKLQVVDRDM